MNAGETPEAALVRELKEELGIEVTAKNLAPFVFASHAYEGFHLLMPLYLCRRWTGKPKPREGQALAWVEPDRLVEYPMPPADRPLIPMLRDFYEVSMSNPTAAVLIIGNEILSGRTQDVNVNFLAKRLAARGIVLAEVRVVPDIPERIIRAVNELRAAYGDLFTTGGIGPTHDDITSECIAEAFGVSWEPHPETFAALDKYLAGRFNAAQQRMATMPRGAVPIPNEVSIAPGFTMGNVHVMAGVPKIMQSMFDSLEPALPQGVPIAMRAVYGMGVMEGSVAEGLSAIQDRFANVDLGSYPFRRAGTWGVAFVAKGTDLRLLEAVIAEASQLIAAQGIEPIQGEPE